MLSYRGLTAVSTNWHYDGPRGHAGVVADFFVALNIISFHYLFVVPRLDRGIHQLALRWTPRSRRGATNLRIKASVDSSLQRCSFHNCVLELKPAKAPLLS